MDAATKAIEGQSRIQQHIDEANKKGDNGQAEYLTGVLALQVAADNKRLENVIAAGSAISNAQASQWAQEEQAYGAHLDKLLATYAQKTGGKGIPGISPPPATGGTSSGGVTSAAPVPAAAPAPGTAQPVIDIATPAAVDQQTGQLLGAINNLGAGLATIADRVSAVERAVGSLKGSRTFATN